MYFCSISTSECATPDRATKTGASKCIGHRRLRRPTCYYDSETWSMGNLVRKKKPNDSIVNHELYCMKCKIQYDKTVDFLKHKRFV